MADLTIGGQAVIEGVMMRSTDRIATAVRLADSRIVVREQAYTSLTKRVRLLGLPVIRGAVSFFEMLIIGITTLNFSAEASLPSGKEGTESPSPDALATKPSSSLSIVLSMALALGMGVFLFFFIPLWIANWVGVGERAVGFNLLAGSIRLVMIILYMWLISLSKEIQRVFEYHGAEHKTIIAYERNLALTAANAAGCTRFHPRCGTSFILIVALSAILTYAVSDTIYAVVSGSAPGLLERFTLHFLLLPLVAGGSYELLRLSGKTSDHPVTRILITPGLWLQRITTREPSTDQLEVAIVALQSALGNRPVDERVVTLQAS